MSEDLEETKLYGGDTRPALLRFVGLPLSVSVGLVMAIPLIMNLMRSWRWRAAGFFLLICVAVFLWTMLRYDHNALRILRRFIQTKFMSFDAQSWKGAVPEPLPFMPPKKPHGIFPK